MRFNLKDKEVIELGNTLANLLSNLDLRVGMSLSSVNDNLKKLTHNLKNSDIRFGNLENFFPYESCISSTNVACHGIPDSKKIQNESLIKVDIVLAKFDAYVDSC